jgi:hypothetical protein
METPKTSVGTALASLAGAPNMIPASSAIAAASAPVQRGAVGKPPPQALLRRFEDPQC